MINFLKEVSAVLIIGGSLLSAIFLWVFFPDYAWIPLSFLGVLIFMGWYRSEPGSGQFLAISFLWMCACVCSFYILRYLVEEHLFLYLSYETESTLIFLGTAAMGTFVTWYAYTSVWNEARERYEEKRKYWDPKTEYWDEVANRAYKKPKNVIKKKKIAKKKVVKKKTTKKRR